MDAYPFELDSFDPDVDLITSEIVRPAVGAADRSIARRACLQILYELDTTGHALVAVLEAHFAERPESYAVRQIIRRIINGVWDARAEIDVILQDFAPEWPIEQVAVIDRNILRIALFEYMLQKRNTPTAVIINEAVHLAQLFGAEHAQGFVHGVLGAIISEAEQEAEPAADEVEES